MADEIEIDMIDGVLNFKVDEKTLEERKAKWQPKPSNAKGYLAKYEKIVEQYLMAFVEKQELDIENCYWVADRVGEILSINEQYYFNFDDIRFDVDNNVKEGLIFKWQDKSIDNYFKKRKYKVNYKNYLKWKTN